MSKLPSPPSVETAALEAGIRQTRAQVASDVRALKSQLTPESLKHRAIDLAERSVESIGLQAARRLAALPKFIAKTGRERPLATAIVGIGLVLIIGKAAARRRARLSHWYSR